MDPFARDTDRVFLRSLHLSLVASKGGPMRARILLALCQRPLHTLALAKELGIDYKTAQYHLEKLQKQNLVLKKGNEYGATYAPTFTPEQMKAFQERLREMGESL